MMAQILYAQNTVTIGKVMYQNQSFSVKDKQIFDADKEGSRVWSLGKAVKYCEKLTLDGYDDWRVASKKEFQAIMTRKPSKNGLFVKAYIGQSGININGCVYIPPNCKLTVSRAYTKCL